MKKHSFIVTLLFISMVLIFKPFIVMAKEDMEQILELKEEMVQESEPLNVDPDEPTSESKDNDEMEEESEPSKSDPEESTSDDIDKEAEDSNATEEPSTTDSEGTDDLEEPEEIDQPQ